MACSEPERLQAVCQQLEPAQVQAFFDKWVDRLPWPLTAQDRAAGYRHRLSIWQMEVCRTHVFTRPLRGHKFFEQLIRENPDLGSLDQVLFIFGRRVRRNARSHFPTLVIRAGVQPSLHITYKHSGVKQYSKEKRTLRTETTINNPLDFGAGKDLSNWSYLRQLAAAT